MEQIPLLDNTAFLRRFGREALFNTTIDLNKFVLHRLEDASERLKRPLPWPFVRSTAHDFVLVTAGEMQCSRGIETFTIRAGTFFFLPAYQISRAIALSPDVQGFYCNFSEAFLAEQLGRNAPLAGLSFWQTDAPALWTAPPAAVERARQLLELIEAAINTSHPEREALAVLYVMALFREINPLVQALSPLSRPANAAAALTARFSALLSRDFVPQRNLADYAALLGVSLNHLNKCVKSTLGKTATDLLDDYLLLEIKVLLWQSNLSLSQIAEQLAFSDLTHLGRFFKKKTDQTLTEFRRLD